MRFAMTLLRCTSRTYGDDHRGVEFRVLARRLPARPQKGWRTASDAGPSSTSGPSRGPPRPRPRRTSRAGSGPRSPRAPCGRHRCRRGPSGLVATSRAGRFRTGVGHAQLGDAEPLDRAVVERRRRRRPGRPSSARPSPRASSPAAAGQRAGPVTTPCSSTGVRVLGDGGAGRHREARGRRSRR